MSRTRLAAVAAASVLLLRDPDGPDAQPTPAAAVSVPNIVGLADDRASSVIEAAGLVYGLPVYVALPDRPEGTVVAQEPAAGG